MEMIFQAAETGHLVLSSMNTIDAASTVERVASLFSTAEQTGVRERFGKIFRYLISQRLIPSANLIRRVPAVEIVTSSVQTRASISVGGNLKENLLRAIKAGASEGMQDFDGEIERLVRSEIVDLETAMANVSDPQNFSRSSRLAQL
jgi:twitching motility protein PilT